MGRSKKRTKGKQRPDKLPFDKYALYQRAVQEPEADIEFIDETLAFNPEWIVDKISPRAVLFITTDDDRLVPPEESIAMFEAAGEPKKLVTLANYGHYEVYSEPAFSEVMRETLAWFGRFVPATA